MIFSDRIDTMKLEIDQEKSLGPYHKHRRRSRCGKPENIAKRNEERTSLILACGHCKIWQMESQYSQQEKKTLIWASARAHIYAFTNVFTQKTLIKIWKTKKEEKEIAVITLGKEISHITEKTTKPIKI